MKTKLYFRNEDAEMCFPLSDHLGDAREEGLETVELLEAVIDKGINKHHIWCQYVGAPGDKSECNKECPYFSRTKGRFCDHRGRLFTYANPQVFDVATGKEVRL